MNVLILANDNTAGIPYNLNKALNEYTDYNSKLVMCKRTYLNLPTGIMASDITYKKFMLMLRQADIIHLNESVVSGIFPAERNIFFKDTTTKVNLYKVLGNRKKVVRHAHGSYIRKFGKHVNKICENHNIKQIITSPDLFSITSSAEWLPQIMPIDRCELLDCKPAPVVADDSLKISHCPTNRLVKHTDKFLKALGKFEHVKPVLIEGLNHIDCLKLRRDCQIHFDQSGLQVYGVSALEGLCMGQVTMVGMGIGSKYAPNHPFVDVNKLGMQEAIYRALDIMNNPRERKFLLHVARKWVEKKHHPKVIASKLSKIYESTKNYR